MGEKNIEIKVEKLTKVFGKHPKRAIQLLEENKTKDEILQETGMTVGVNQASFEVNSGEVFVIMGLSGSGKSTLIRLLNRLIEPTSGNIWIDGKDIAKMNKEQLREIRRKKISMVFQKFALLPHKTIQQNTEYGLEIQGVDKEERAQKARESLNLVGLGGYTDKYPNELSGGMQQRVGLARALANDPDILLMDEAFSALDPLIRKDMQDELLDLHESVGKTIIFITHDLNEALRIGDRIALMRDGVIVQIGTAEEILMDPANDYVERFVEDVDLSKVLTAGHIMKRAESVTPDKGPRVALQMMRDQGISTIYVMDKKRMLLGYVTANQASDAIKEKKSIEEVMTKDVPTVSKDTFLNDLFESMFSANVPLAVVDDQGRLQGIVVKGAVMGAMAGNEDVINGNGVIS
ncbi:quaternary amine ABC transporter ATP-binding protein [Lederbergia galactosidilytica]|uniref:Quaternary amine transport ATP-binding protein n=2 Tax=Lederbergia galactosidilytica TaxID=217031 RepID=A0A177ZSR3_9BACI|nr:glycine betaine/L-proline ABC transporter ATP-binding protein [Lederbergia galactosidilytica]KRG14404.1 glycine/betaine ABC transporter ATP-binding protein [Virgibacillus soli]MBP1916732.1 glycine betaine/proline transport system ATP-binding protein [Lederbergia galactosidilytica]OAK70981.1 glycine/betaine ABC transporter ATP-binding protein [Lederbergia galactosidilytica]